MPAVGNYEEDHLIPLELGGSPSDPKNLWPEPGGAPNAKDKVENAAKQAVCDGSIGLVAAQKAIASNWIVLGERLGALVLASPTTTTTAVPSTTEPTSTLCSPLSSTGHCYKPGQMCPSTSYGRTGIGDGGEPIKCVDNNGWRWEPL